MKAKCASLLFIFIVICIVSGIFSAFAQEQSQPQAAPRFSISTIVIAEDVQDREPVGVEETFPASTEEVYCFIEATNISADTEATFVWYHEGQEMRSFTLPIMQGPRWRTYAYKNLYGKTGNWKVEIRDTSNNLVKSITFKVE
jgi:hypothetical protein